MTHVDTLHAALEAAVDQIVFDAELPLRDQLADLAAQGARLSAQLVEREAQVASLARDRDRLDGLADTLAGKVVDLQAEVASLQASLKAARPRCLWGTAGQNGKSQANYETFAGKPVGVRREYFGATETTQMVGACKRDLAAGRLPWHTMKFGTDWAGVAAGADDARLRAVRDQLIALNAEVWISFHHEPEWDEAAGPLPTDGATVKAEKLAAAKAAHARWREAQRRAATIFAEVPSRIRFWLVTTGWGQVAEPNRVAGGTDWANLYPVGAPIYGIAFDPYKNKSTTDMIASYVAPLKAEADRRGVHWAIAETGVDTTDWQSERDWFQKLYDYVAANGGLAVAYFDTTLNSSRAWTLGTWPNEKAQAFAEVLKRS